jgi:transcriptional regulator with XRE-family HTH domain
MGILSEEIAKVIHRKRRGFRFTQSDLGQRIGVSGSYISSLESGKASPRIVELEELATHFRTTAADMIEEAMSAGKRSVPITETRGAEGLDAIAADLSLEHRRVAREFLLFLRERERVDKAPAAAEDG